MQWEEIPRDQIQIPGERVTPGTPFFRWENVFNEPQSRIQGKPVYEMKEVVEIRFPANPQYKPVFGVDEMCTMDDNGRVITWAERYKPQYQAFLAGDEQQAEGTPLEELLPFGISQSQLSLCRALNIYSIEALHHLEGPGLKRLGVHGNELKPMAKRWMVARASGTAQQHEINELKRQLAELQAKGGSDASPADPFLSNVMQESEPTPLSDEDLSAEGIKAEIKNLTGSAPRGNPSLETLKVMLEQAREEQLAA